MSKRHSHKLSGRAASSSAPAAARGRIIFGAVLIGALLLVAAVWWSQHPTTTQSSPRALAITNAPLQTNTVAQSVMVTVELDFGTTPPRLEDAMKEIERRSQPSEGVGRTFTILDADGTVTANGQWRLQMHVSMEKPGAGALVFRRTGDILWQSTILPAPGGPPPQKQLTVLMADDAGQSVLLDGSQGASRILDTPLHNSPQRVRDAWPDGTEREFTFIYSACGCPVKARVRRTGETSARTSDRPVMFPDDPDAMNVIRTLMGWNSVR